MSLSLGNVGEAAYSALNLSRPTSLGLKTHNPFLLQFFFLALGMRVTELKRTCTFTETQP